MINIFNFYSHWIFILSIIEKWSKISVYPSVIFCLIVAISIAFFYKLRVTIIILLLLTHGFPLLWCKQNLTKPVIIQNIFIGVIYLIFIKCRKTTVYDIYNNQYSFLKKKFTFKDLFSKFETNMCLLC